MNHGRVMKYSAVKLALTMASVILTVTAIAKIISSFGQAAILVQPDPLLGVSVRTSNWIVAAVEIAVACLLWWMRDYVWRSLLIVIMGAEFLLYHMMLIWGRVHGPCPCLGSAWKWMGVSDKWVGIIAMGLGCYLLTSGLLILFSVACDRPKWEKQRPPVQR